MSTTWRALLSKLVQVQGSELFPLLVFKVEGPAGLPWPPDLPFCEGIKDFYAICDGGTLSLGYNFLPMSRLESGTAAWRERLHDYHGDGKAILFHGRHLVLGEDGAGAPLIWDAEEDLLATFFWKGGDWEPLHLGFEAFMEQLFAGPHSEEDSMWSEALDQAIQHYDEWMVRGVPPQ